MTVKSIYSLSSDSAIEAKEENCQTITIDKQLLISAVLELERQIDTHVTFLERVDKLGRVLQRLIERHLSDSTVLRAKADLLRLFLSDHEWDKVFRGLADSSVHQD